MMSLMRSNAKAALDTMRKHVYSYETEEQEQLAELHLAKAGLFAMIFLAESVASSHAEARRIAHANGVAASEVD